MTYSEQKVGIVTAQETLTLGTDWPLLLPGGTLEIMAKEYAPKVGFRKGDALPTTEILTGFSG